MAWAIRGGSSTGNADSAVTSLQIFLVGFRVDVGDLIAVLIGNRTSSSVTVTGVTDDRGNTYTQRKRQAANGQFVEAWTAIAVSGDDTTVTVSFSGSCSPQVTVAGLSGAPASVAVPDSSGTNAVAATSHSCGTVSAIAGDLVLTVSSMSGSAVATANAAYTTLDAESRLYSQWKDVSGAFSDSGTWVSDSGIDTTSLQIVIRDASSSSSPLTDGKIIFTAR